MRKYPNGVIPLKARSTTGRVCPEQVRGVCLIAMLLQLDQLHDTHGKRRRDASEQAGSANVSSRIKRLTGAVRRSRRFSVVNVKLLTITVSPERLSADPLTNGSRAISYNSATN